MTEQKIDEPDIRNRAVEDEEYAESMEARKEVADLLAKAGPGAENAFTIPNDSDLVRHGKEQAKKRKIFGIKI